jgi:hypothetical protein
MPVHANAVAIKLDTSGFVILSEELRAKWVPRGRAKSRPTADVTTVVQ